MKLTSEQITQITNATECSSFFDNIQRSNDINDVKIVTKVLNYIIVNDIDVIQLNDIAKLIKKDCEDMSEEHFVTIVVELFLYARLTCYERDTNVNKARAKARA